MYYTLDGRQFASKIDGLYHASEIQSPLHFFYHDPLYDLINWKQEPLSSLDELYLEQAKRIRDSYDYVILCYSGGYDSSNILETFHYNGIKLDNIVTVGALNEDLTVNSDANHNGELYHNVFPYLEQLGLMSITQVLDYSTHFNSLNSFSVLAKGEQWIHQTGGWFSPHNWFWRDIHLHIVPPEFKSKKVAIIFGRDKPILRETEQGLAFAFSDTAITSYGNMASVDGIDRINFYWDPTFPDILVKQLHILKRHREKSIMEYNKRLSIQSFGSKSTNDLIYNLRRPIIYKSPKSPTNILSLRDSFLKTKQNSDVFEIYQSGISHMRDIINTNTITPVFSKLYYV